MASESRCHISIFAVLMPVPLSCSASFGSRAPSAISISFFPYNGTSRSSQKVCQITPIRNLFFGEKVPKRHPAPLTTQQSCRKIEASKEHHTGRHQMKRKGRKTMKTPTTCYRCNKPLSTGNGGTLCPACFLHATTGEVKCSPVVAPLLERGMLVEFE